LVDAKSDEDKSFYEGKLAACRYFYRYELIRVASWADLVESLDDTTFSMDADHF